MNLTAKRKTTAREGYEKKMSGLQRTPVQVWGCVRQKRDMQISPYLFTLREGVAKSCKSLDKEIGEIPSGRKEATQQ